MALVPVWADEIEVNGPDRNALKARKQEIRKRVWSLLEQRNVARFPRPIFGRIPNFEGADLAAGRLRRLTVFQEANVVKVSPDAPQKPVRESVLEQRKRLVVPTPRLRKGFLMIDPIELSKIRLPYAATIKGSWEYGKPVQLNNLPKVDLIVTGSVAVSRDGVRLGKGGGYSEIEYGILREFQRVDDETMILTTVHDLQIVEEVPAEEHDLSVDMIVTPTKVIDTVRKRRRPQGILWDEVTDEMLENMPILKELAKLREDKAT
jgi:5-formyltetrahydrofolate cyclo-ligase